MIGHEIVVRDELLLFLICFSGRETVNLKYIKAIGVIKWVGVCALCNNIYHFIKLCSTENKYKYCRYVSLNPTIINSQWQPNIWIWDHTNCHTAPSSVNYHSCIIHEQTTECAHVIYKDPFLFHVFICIQIWFILLFLPSHGCYPQTRFNERQHRHCKLAK